MAIVAHEIAKLMLEHADTFLERSEAVKTALYLGMPLEEIESYLDWLESVRAPSRSTATEPKRAAARRNPATDPAGHAGDRSIRPFGCTPPFLRPAGQ